MVKAKAFLTGWIPSAIAEENYQFPNSSANGNQAPLVTGISSVYPNPFKDILTIELAIKEGIRDYSFKIYNLRGECVFSSPGVAKNAFKLSWDGKARDGSKLPAGVYLIRFKTKEHLNTKRVILY
jgi:flagellar hook assembly protein FlgD